MVFLLFFYKGGKPMDQLGELICRVKNRDGESFEIFNGWE